MSWQLQEAKQKLSRVVDLARSEGPQVITRHGREVAVLVSAERYRAMLATARPTLRQVLLDGLGAGEDLEAFLPQRHQERSRPLPELKD